MAASLIVGLGRSGLAVAARLASEGRAFRCLDDRPPTALTDPQARMLALHGFDGDLSKIGQVIVSPGVPAEHPLLRSALERGVEVISELEFAFRRATGSVVAVTGSNGKSTTVTLIADLLRGAGFKPQLCGNIGVSFTESLLPERATYVVEVSSFQLEWIHAFNPQVGVLLNLSADHLDRHHTLEAYRAAKLRMFENQDEAQIAILPPGLADHKPGRGQVVRVPDRDVGLDGDRLMLGPGCTLDTTDYHLMGRHNLINLLFAALSARAVGVTTPQIQARIPQLRGLEHRLEVLGSVQGRTWVNDSKATNPASTQVAIEAMTRPYVLILGGSDKDTDFGEIDFSANPPRAIIAYGETAAKAERQLRDIPLTRIEGFDEACRIAQQQAVEGDLVLMSPACASFDQFQNFMARGARFKAIFRGLEVSA